MQRNKMTDFKSIPFIFRFLRLYIFNKYVITVALFAVWIIFIDSNSLLVINDLSQEISKYKRQLNYYKSEYQKNDAYYKKLMNNKAEKEKFARENYFMKRKNEEIFIIVADSTKIKN